jgi:rod shape determining protein RodA
MRNISSPISRIAPIQLPEDVSWLRRLGNVHWGLLLAAMALSLVGLFTIRSAAAEQGEAFFTRQVVWIALGLVLMACAFAIDYRRLFDLSPAFYAICLVFLVLILFLGHEAGGARSWIGIGGFGGQPSEPTKLVMALLLTRFLSSLNKPFLELRDIAIATGLVLPPMALIIAERDLGGAAMFAAMLGAMLLVTGVRKEFLIAAALLGIVIAWGAWHWGLKEYQRARIVSFLSPDQDPLGSGYQVRQSKIAVGSGQLTGRGYGQGTQSQLRFLPARHTDFIIAVLAEERGFVGVGLVLCGFLLYITSAATIAMRSRDRAGTLLVVGLVAMMVVHVVYNTSMVIGFLPITGIPLPFLSYGGSFTLMNFVATGLILNVDFRRYVNR